MDRVEESGRIDIIKVTTKPMPLGGRLEGSPESIICGDMSQATARLCVFLNFYFIFFVCFSWVSAQLDGGADGSADGSCKQCVSLPAQTCGVCVCRWDARGQRGSSDRASVLF